MNSYKVTITIPKLKMTVIEVIKTDERVFAGALGMSQATSKGHELNGVSLVGRKFDYTVEAL